jgi:hypothetical protein
LALSAFTLSIAVYTGMLHWSYVVWHTPYVWQFPPQIWRLVTSFLMTGKDLSIIFDTYFCMLHFGTGCRMSAIINLSTVYTYGSKLETASPRFSQPGDFMTYLLFVCFTILVGIFLLLFASFLWHLTLSARIVQFPQLLRFLEMRKITLALRLARHSQSIQRVSSRCRHGGKFL